MTADEDQVPDAHEEALMIGEFSRRSGLSAKALRLYDELGLLPPARVAPDTGYRYYAADQVGRARLVALMRHLEMPLADIREVLDLAPAQAVVAVRAYWAGHEAALHRRRDVVDYVCDVLIRKDPTMTREDHSDPGAGYEVMVREMPARAVLTALRHVEEGDASAVLGALLGRMSQAGPGLGGLEGCPHMIFHGAVGADSDGPVEIVRPMADPDSAQDAAQRLGDVQAGTDAAHTEAVVRLTLGQTGWPAMLPVLDAIEAHLRSVGRRAAGPPRQVMIADWRTVAPDTPACDLVVPVAAVS